MKVKSGVSFVIFRGEGVSLWGVHLSPYSWVINLMLEGYKTPDYCLRNETNYPKHFRKYRSTSPSYTDNPFLDSILSDSKEKKLPPLKLSFKVSSEVLPPVNSNWRPSKSNAMARIRKQIQNKIDKFKHREEELEQELKETCLKEFEAWQTEKVQRSLDEMKKPCYLHVCLDSKWRRNK